uniref:Uncharacterized protein n=1 Tax=Setaria viridis TaxID=4556 RepID=A0A4U6VPH5_SETVI|nr:LOW QUALITY PROTEIN: hypothetical protein SEVIR_3G410300v2 [Setaria viridis]
MVATKVRAVVMAVLLMQCCNVILAARPLLDAATGDGHAWQLGHGGEAQIMQAPKGPGGGNCDFKSPQHPHLLETKQEYTLLCDWVPHLPTKAEEAIDQNSQEAQAVADIAIDEADRER